MIQNMQKMNKLTIVAASIILLAGTEVQAQMAVPELPVDKEVKIGKLENGLTYYIRHNEEPKGQANFYIAQKVGSILEEEEQRGLAHFLEHMCFNGSEHFKGNGIVKYCESIGVQFGGDLNAYTSIDETVYNIDNVPVATFPTAVDSCLYILYDWANGLLLEADDIDHERGVIHEEWRSRRNAQIRQYEQILPKIYPGNKYGERMPIGLIEVIDNFPYQAIRDYYEKWYRPDQQGIVIVGDIDVDEVEKKIQKIFSVIPTPVNPAERYYLPIEDNKEPIIALAKDKEQPYAVTFIFMKHEPVPAEMKSSLNYAIIDYANAAVSTMLSLRLHEMTQSPEPPFMQASVSDDDFFLSKTEGALTGAVYSNEKEMANAMQTLYREMLRAIRNGFTGSEYERFKADFLTQIESQYNQREKQKSASFCSEYVRHFIDNEPIMGIENEYALFSSLVPQIGIEVINQYLQELVSDSNLVVVSMLPDKEDVVYPSESDVAKMLEAVAAEDIEPYVDSTSDEPLMAQLPTPGKIVSSKDSKFGYKMFKLSNGATVYFQQTDFNKDNIQMRAFSWGGTSLYPDDMALDLKNIDVFTVGGVGQFNIVDLNKVLAGKKVSVSPSISKITESMSSSSTPKDIETMMQLTHLYFTAQRPDGDAFKSWQTRTKATLMNAESNPISALQDTIYKYLYDNNPRITKTKSADIDNVNYDNIMKIAAERFANAADFNFIITGAISEEEITPLIEQYIASLPSVGKKEKYKNNLPMSKGSHEVVFERQMEQEMATVLFVESGKAKYNLKNSLTYDIAGQILDIIYTEEIREKEGGTYGVSTAAEVMNDPEAKALVQIQYQTDPEKFEHLNAMISSILDDFSKNGSTEENLAKVKEYMVKNHQEGLRENSYWQSVLLEYLMTGVDIHTEWEKTLESITMNDVSKAISNTLKQKNSVKLIMKGVK